MTTSADPGTFPSVLDAPTVPDVPAVEAPAVAGAPVADAPTAPDVPAVEAPAVAEAPVADTPVDFAGLGLPAELVRALHRDGITSPFPIQAATVPDALAGRDVLGRGQTGSGKTLAFGLPLLARVAAGGRARPLRPRALILVPTRELAMQVADALQPLGRTLGVFLKTAVGGVPYDRQIDALRRGVEVVVATPGRLGDLINRGVCDLADVTVTVLDEADQMADMGFLPEVTELLAKTPADAQRLLFSATLDGDVDALVQRFMTDPVTHSTAPAEASVTTMDHHLLLIPPADKFAITAAIANRPGRTMVFARTQLGVDRLVGQLAEVGVRAGALHGGKTQRVRTRTLAEFKEGRTPVLVATDVAARGIHVDGVSLVVHVDPPKDPKDYLHRAGRTARAGESGAVVTLVLPKQRRTTRSMLDRAGVEPAEVRVRLGDEKLTEVTGAREPSGVPVVDEPEPRPRRDRPRRGFDRPRDGRGFDRPRGERATGDRPYRGTADRPHRDTADRPHRDTGDRPYRGAADRPFRGSGDRPYRDRGAADRPGGDRPFGDRSRGQGDRTHGDRPHQERGHTRPDRGFGDRPGRGPRRDDRHDGPAPRRSGPARPARH